MSLKPLPEFGDLYSIEGFMDLVKGRIVTDEDGSAYYATEEGISDIEAKPSVLLNGWPMTHTGEFTSIMWFNK